MWRPTLRISWKCLLALINILLLALLSLKLIFISVHLSHGQSRLPHFVQKIIESKLAQESLSLQSASIYYDLEGHLLLKDFTLRNPNLNITIAQGEYAQIRISRLALLWGDLSLEEIKLMETSLYGSPMYSHSGQNQALIKKINLSLHRSPRYWIIQQAQAQVGTIPISARGNFSQWILPETQTDTSWQNRYFSSLASLEELLSHTQDLTNPQINLSLSQKEKDAYTQITLHAHAQNLKHQAWTAQHAKIEISTVIPQDLTTFSLIDDPRLSAQLEISQGQTPQQITTTHLVAHAQGQGFHLSHSQWEIQACLHQLNLSSGPTIPYSHLSIDKKQNLWPQLQAFAYYQDQPTLLQLRCSALGQWHGHIESSLNPSQLLQAWPELPIPPQALPRIPQIEMQDRLHWTADITTSLWGRIQNIDLNIQAWDLRVNQLPLTQAKAQVRWDGQQSITIPSWTLRHRDYQAQGSLDIDLASATLQLYVDGSLHPWDIQPWMPRWWPLIWKNFDLQQQTVSGDFYVKVPLVFRRDWLVFGDAQGGGVRFRGLDLDQGHATVLVIPQFVDVYNIHAQRPEGSVQGAVQWIYRLGERRPLYTSFQIQSDISPLPFAQCIGSNIEGIVEDFSLNTPPQVDVSGKIFDRQSGLTQHSWVRTQVQHQGPSSYHQYPLENLAFIANYQNQTVDLPKIQALFAQGQLQAHATYDIPQNSLQVQADLSQAREQDLRQIIQSPAKEDSNGLVDIRFTGTGSAGNLLSFQGQGHASIQEAKLGKIPLFGFISQYFMLGSLSLNRAESAFKLDKNILSFQDAIVKGPTTQVTASGSHNLSNKAIDIRAKVLPLRQIPFFIPIASVLETHLTGTLEKPKWSLRNSPTRIFKKPKTDPMIPQ